MNVKPGYQVDNSDVIELQTGCEDSDGFRHYMVSPAVWKGIAEGVVKEGSYRYWHRAYWMAGNNPMWDSIWDFVASLVEEVEDMIERGVKYDNGDGDDALSSESEKGNEIEEDAEEGKEEEIALRVKSDDGESLKRKLSSGNLDGKDEEDSDWVKVGVIAGEGDVNGK